MSQINFQQINIKLLITIRNFIDNNKNQMNDRLRNINQKISKSTIQIERLMSQLCPTDRPIATYNKSRHQNKQHQQINPEDLTKSAQRRGIDQNLFKKFSNMQTNASTKFQESRQKFTSSFKDNHQSAKKQNSFNHFFTQYNPRGQINNDTKFSVGHQLYPNANYVNNEKISSKNNLAKINKVENFSKNIFQIDHNYVLNYALNKCSLTPNSKPEEIFDYFSSFAPMFNRPLIKKFKNCLYFGQSPQHGKYRSRYNGFLYFYTSKLYYGNFQQQFKHGLGVQINLKNSMIYKGNFNKGHKVGNFQVICGDKIYYGPLSKGKFQGVGKLQTSISIYEGQFFNGMRHGQGTQFFFKSGLKLKGIFQMDKFCNDQNFTKNKQQQRQYSSVVKRQRIQPIQSKSSRKDYNIVKLSNMFDFSYHDSQQQDQDSVQKKSNIRWKCVKNQLNIAKKKKQKYENRFQNSLMQQASDDDPLPSPFRKIIYNK